ncbi:MAG: hypothetical protein KatS3mg110_1774 [Pirellulaceae bacterium]|nr:MAG: hypothetical protein KatS3mg110_1774 [Pirellulaceae bacterium]
MGSRDSVDVPPLSDSPWFWVYLFATGALVVLLLAGPRVISRQVQLERNLQARQRAAQVVAGQQPRTPLSEEGHPQISLTPLYVVLAGLVAVGWIGLWWSRHRLRYASGQSALADPDTSQLSQATTPRSPTESTGRAHHNH